MKNTKRITISGVIAALSTAIIYISTVSELFSFTGCYVAALLVLFIRIEFGIGTSISVYAIVSILSWLLLPDKSIAAVYTLIAGMYPIIKQYFDRILSTPLRILCKLLYFNADAVMIFFLSKLFFAPDTEADWILPVTLVLSNAVFLLADKLADRITLIYNVKYRPILLRRGIL